MLVNIDRNTSNDLFIGVISFIMCACSVFVVCSLKVGGNGAISQEIKISQEILDTKLLLPKVNERTVIRSLTFLYYDHV